jgi:hypothetical protein
MTPAGIHTKIALVRSGKVRSSLSTAAQTSKAGYAVGERWQQNRQLRNDEGRCSSRGYRIAGGGTLFLPFLGQPETGGKAFAFYFV